MNSKVLNLSRARTTTALKLLRGDDSESDRETATKILLQHLRNIGENEIADLYDKTASRCRFFF